MKTCMPRSWLQPSTSELGCLWNPAMGKGRFIFVDGFTTLDIWFEPTSKSPEPPYLIVCVEIPWWRLGTTRMWVQMTFFLKEGLNEQPGHLVKSGYRRQWVPAPLQPQARNFDFWNRRDYNQTACHSTLNHWITSKWMNETRDLLISNRLTNKVVISNKAIHV